MGIGRAGVEPATPGLRPRGFVALLAVIAATLVVHLLGPALQSPSAAAAPAHEHVSLDLGAEHGSDGPAALVAETHADQSCHWVPGVSPASTALPMAGGGFSTWPRAGAAEIDRSGLHPAQIGGEGAGALADPRRSPGVQRT